MKIKNFNKFKYLKKLSIDNFKINSNFNNEDISELFHLEYLSIYNINKITNLNHLENLTYLNIGGKCKVTIENISKLKLETLDVSGRSDITDLNCFSRTLKNINICYCGVNDDGISQCLLLEDINADNNKNITNLNRFQKLQIIDISEHCGVDDVGISELRCLKQMKMVGNVNYKKIDKMLIGWYYNNINTMLLILPDDD